MAAPKYEVMDYYDAERAMQRIIYTKEIKKFSSEIKKLGFMNDNLYSLAISKINDGIYNNLGSLYLESSKGNRRSMYIGANKSSRNQDFMSPLELRINSLAVRLAIANISNVNFNMVNQVLDACYSAGQHAAAIAHRVRKGSGVFSFSIPDPVRNSSVIVKNTTARF